MANREAPADELSSPQPPTFTAVIDERHGTVRGNGRLDHLSADLLCGTVDTLRQRGHRHITVALSGLWMVQPAARARLEAEIQRQAAQGVRLLLL
jgi:hypothetical protein